MLSRRSGTNTMYTPSTDYALRVCVVGGGAAGMMAAGTAVRYGAEVTVFESTGRLGKKLAIKPKIMIRAIRPAKNEISFFLLSIIKHP